MQIKRAYIAARFSITIATIDSITKTYFLQWSTKGRPAPNSINGFVNTFKAGQRFALIHVGGGPQAKAERWSGFIAGYCSVAPSDLMSNFFLRVFIFDISDEGRVVQLVALSDELGLVVPLAALAIGVGRRDIGWDLGSENGDNGRAVTHRRQESEREKEL